MRPRFVGRLGLADAVTVGNAVLGFVAAVVATVDVGVAARLVLLAGIADAVDGIVAREVGSTPAGAYLDSLADVASFAVAPALLVAVHASDYWTRPLVAVTVGLPALFVAMAVVRLGLYTAYDIGDDRTEGVQTTLAATVLAACVLAGVHTPLVLVGLTGVLAVLMVTRITYPDLHPQDAAVMGVVQGLAVVATGWIGRGFAWALLVLSVSYLVFSPLFYWE